MQKYLCRHYKCKHELNILDMFIGPEDLSPLQSLHSKKWQKTEVDWSLQPRCCVLKFQLLAANAHFVGALRTCRVTNIMPNAHACAGPVEQPGAGACQDRQHPRHPIRHQTPAVSHALITFLIHTFLYNKGEEFSKELYLK